MTVPPHGATRSPFLPPDPRVEEPYHLTPRAAARIAIFGVLAVVLFALLFFRLWALQVISGDEYLDTAQNNQIRTVRLQAPRGPILDANGRVLVANVPGTVVQLWPAYTDGRLDEVVSRLSELLDVPQKELREQIKARANDPLTPIPVKTNVHEARANYIQEHRSEFPGVEVATTHLRRYEYGPLAAQILGYVGEIDAQELERFGPGYAGGDRIGKTGIERAYDTFLRGEPGVAQARFNARNELTSAPQPSQQPKAGYAVRLTIDIELQRAAEAAIRHGIALAREDGNWAANGGAIVAMDPRDGAILALASNPTYDPSVFAGRIDPRKYTRLFAPNKAAALNHPTLNRAIDGVYPAGSTFKPVTALAALAEGLISAEEYFQCDGGRTIDDQRFDNWDPYVNEPMTLTTALARSCDTYFYDVAIRFYEQEKSPLQAWASKLGFGASTGVDLGPENTGLVPTPAWRERTFADPVDKLWTSGDSVQLAIGQGDLLVTPLQLTRFYALVANGGRLVNPYLVRDVEQPASSREEAPVVLRSFEPRAPRSVGLSESAIRAVQQGLYGATHDPDGTATPIFGGYQVPVAGKTGTAEKYVQLPPGYLGLEDWDRQLRDQAWFCGYGPTDASGTLAGESPLVVCALIENGGHGGDVAAPAALQVFEEYWDVEAPEVVGEVYSD
jgi:penicillin-binding protein 2